MTECFNCHYNLGGLHCAIHEQINLHGEYCKDYEERRIRYVKYDGDVE